MRGKKEKTHATIQTLTGNKPDPLKISNMRKKDQEQSINTPQCKPPLIAYGFINPVMESN